MPLKGLRVGVLRHFWEEDGKATPDVAAAMARTAEALASLGAVVETARIAPVQDWYDVKIVIAESELFNVHRTDLLTRPRDFGQDFLARSLGALLFTGQDYVAAQRRRRQLLAEMRDVYRRFDLLLAPTAGGAAPRLDAHRTGQFWKAPNFTTPFNVTAGPALSLCIGFSDAGLPLAGQLVGRPFDDARVLAACAQLEPLVSERARRPDLSRPATPATVPTLPPPTHDLGAEELRRIEAIAAAAGFPLDDLTLGLLAEAAPYAWAMGRRLRRDFSYADEPSSIFVHKI